MKQDHGNIILVPFDFSEQAQIALEQSYNLARLSRAVILLLYVLDEDTFNPLSFITARKNDEEKERVWEQSIRDKLKEVATSTKKEIGVQVDYRMTKGKVYDQIVEVAEDVKATFIVMGTNGATNLKKKFIGSNAFRVVREAKIPVITIKGKDHRKGCKTILLPLDLTRETREKVNEAIQFANYFGSAIRIVSVTTTNDDLVMQKLQFQMSQVEAFIRKNDIAVSGEIIHDSNIVKTILEYAQKIDADLIMIMTQQEVDFTDLFVGHAAHQLINNSEIPVLSIRPSEKDNTASILAI